MYYNTLFFHKKSISIEMLLFYNVGPTPGPIGNPIIYHPISNNIHVADMIKK